MEGKVEKRSGERNWENEI